MGEKFSDGAIVQHMSKLRQKMVENNLQVPPPLKRGTTVVPSKIYAPSASARRKPMIDIPSTAAAVLTTPKTKPGAKKRNRRAGLDTDSDSQLDENDMDIGDTEDEDYGASGKKKKKMSKAKKTAKKPAIPKRVELDGEAADRINGNHISTNSAGIEESIIESIETQGPASRTRGVRPDYARLEQASDEEDEHHDPRVKEEDHEEEEEGGEEEEEEEEEEEMTSTVTNESPKVESDGDVSPLSRIPDCPVTPAAHFTVEVSPKPVAIAQQIGD
jgi:hypothetical protein